jgi:hypothetical protein
MPPSEALRYAELTTESQIQALADLGIDPTVEALEAGGYAYAVELARSHGREADFVAKLRSGTQSQGVDSSTVVKKATIGDA